MGKRFGLDPNVMIDVMNVSTGKNFNTENVVKQHVVSRRSSPPASRSACWRRMSGSRPISRSAIDVDSPLTRLSSALLGEARDKVGSEKDHTLAYTYWEKRDKKAAAE